MDGRVVPPAGGAVSVKKTRPTGWFFFFLMFPVLAVVLALHSTPSEVPLKECAEVHILQTWYGMAPDGSTVRHLHAFVHEQYAFVIDMRSAIPQWPDALLCFFPPDSA